MRALFRTHWFQRKAGVLPARQESKAAIGSHHEPTPNPSQEGNRPDTVERLIRAHERLGTSWFTCRARNTAHLSFSRPSREVACRVLLRRIAILSAKPFTAWAT